MAYYLDATALARLVSIEIGSDALRDWLAAEDRDPLSSDLARTELLRATRRRDELATSTARAALEVVGLVPLSASTFDAAGLLAPTGLGTLDALHIAAALSIGDDLEGFVTYDERLARAAVGCGLRVVAPGADWAR